MKIKHMLSVLCIALGLCTPALASGTSKCPPGTFVEVHSGNCLPVRDMTGQIVEPSPITPPSLLELRQGTAPQPRPKLPTPGGIGAGIYYYNGQLQAIHGSNLQTTMIVHSTTGLDPSNSGLTWLFTTSTNRTQMGVEVVGIFFQNNPNESLGIYDWSCSVSYPCEQGTTASATNPSPAWIWVTLMSNLACYTKTELSDAGFVDQVMQYMNQTNELVAGNPPTWENEVYLLNYCDNHWDKIYQHLYVASQIDCSLNSACGWWGPILETFPSSSNAVFPQINELGFNGTSLEHDGVTSFFSPAEGPASPTPQSVFGYPEDPWELLYLDANRNYEVGNYVQDLTTQDCMHGGWRQFDFTSQNQCDNYADDYAIDH